MKKLIFSIALFAAPAFADEPAWSSCEFWATATPSDLAPVFDRESLEWFRSLLEPEEVDAARSCYEAKLPGYISIIRSVCTSEGELGEEDGYLETEALACMMPYFHN